MRYAYCARRGAGLLLDHNRDRDRFLSKPCRWAIISYPVASPLRTEIRVYDGASGDKLAGGARL